MTLVNARYPRIPTTIRAHYPNPYRHYADRNEPLPRDYCPGSGQPAKEQP